MGNSKASKIHASGAISGTGWRVSHTRERRRAGSGAAESQRLPKTKGNAILWRAE